MRNVWATIAAAGLIIMVPSATAAQDHIPIHGHPQATEYATPADWVKKPSTQSHWARPASTTTPCHVHIEPTFPWYMEWANDILAFPVDIQLFHCTGVLQQVWSRFGGFVFDDIGHWVEYPMIRANPNGVMVLHATFYYNPAQADSWDPEYRVPGHGWTGIPMSAKIFLDDGTTMEDQQKIPFWSVRRPWEDPVPGTQPCDGCGPQWRSANSVNSPTDALNAWGNAIVDVNSMIPIRPLTLGTVWPLFMNIFGYGTQSGLSNRIECRLDADLHNGYDGLVVPGCFTATSPVIDTNEICSLVACPGTHKISFRLIAESGAGVPGLFGPDEMAAALAVIPFTVSDGSGPTSPVDCAQGEWFTVSTSASAGEWAVVGDHEERTITTTTMQHRDTLTPASNGGVPCGPSMQTLVTTSVETRPLPAPLTLTAVGSKLKGIQRAALAWSGFATAVDIYRDGALVLPATPNDGSQLDVIGRRGGGSYTYRACAAGSETACSNTATVTF